jgi:uncharacterized protein YciW
MQTKFDKILEARRVTRKPKYRKQDNIKVNLKEAGWECVDWICLAQNKNW